MRAIRHMSGTAQDTRLPIMWWMLIKILSHHPPATVSDKNCMAIALLGREGLYRIGELTAATQADETYPRLEQWKVEDQIATFTLLKSKTNPWREKIQVVHPVITVQGCGATYLQSIIQSRPERRRSPVSPLFQTNIGHPITRAIFVRWLKSSLTAIGTSDNRLKGHSLCIGGATELQAMGVPDTMIQAAGRWRSSCYQLYIRAPTAEQIKIITKMFARTEEPR